MEVTKQIAILRDSFSKIETAENEEKRFYALCEYLSLLGDDYELKRLMEKHFSNSTGMYMKAGNVLFDSLERKGISPQTLWSEALKTSLGGGNRELVMFASNGGSASVGRIVHNSLMESLHNIEVSDKVELVLDVDSSCVYVKSDPLRRYEIKSKGKDGDKKRFKIIHALNQTSKWLTTKEIAEITETSDEPTALKQINGINGQFKKNTELTRDLIVRQKKDNKFTYHLNTEDYFFTEKSAGS